MAKNNQLINAMKSMRFQIEAEITNIYGGLAMALNEVGIPPEQIVALFNKSSDYWNRCIDEGRNMTDWVAQEVGIDLKHQLTNGKIISAGKDKWKE